MTAGNVLAYILLAVFVCVCSALLVRLATSEDRFIEEWYSNGPYRAVWTKSGIRVQNTTSGVFDRSLSLDGLYGTDERRAKLCAARENRSHAIAVKARKLYAEKAGEIIP